MYVHTYTHTPIHTYTHTHTYTRILAGDRAAFNTKHSALSSLLGGPPGDTLDSSAKGDWFDLLVENLKLLTDNAASTHDTVLGTYTHTYAYMHTYIHTYIHRHTHTHTSIHPSIHPSIHHLASF